MAIFSYCRGFLLLLVLLVLSFISCLVSSGLLRVLSICTVSREMARKHRLGNPKGLEHYMPYKEIPRTTLGVGNNNVSIDGVQDAGVLFSPEQIDALQLLVRYL